MAQGYQGYGDRIQQLRRHNALMNPANQDSGVMLAYGLNKNLKKLRSDRPKSAKVLRAVGVPKRSKKSSQLPQ